MGFEGTDVDLHEKSVKAIRKKLCDKGYFDSYVEDELNYEKKSKTILVKLHIKKKKCFRIKKVIFSFKKIKCGNNQKHLNKTHYKMHKK